MKEKWIMKLPSVSVETSSNMKPALCGAWWTCVYTVCVGFASFLMKADFLKYFKTCIIYAPPVYWQSSYLFCLCWHITWSATSTCRSVCCLSCVLRHDPGLTLNGVEQDSSLPSEAVCKSFCCSEGGGGCVARGGVRTPSRSARTRRVFLRCAGPGAPSGPASGRRSSHSEDRRTDAPLGDSSGNNTIIIEIKCVISTAIVSIHGMSKLLLVMMTKLAANKGAASKGKTPCTHTPTVKKSPRWRSLFFWGYSVVKCFLFLQIAEQRREQLWEQKMFKMEWTVSVTRMREERFVYGVSQKNHIGRQKYTERSREGAKKKIKMISWCKRWSFWSFRKSVHDSSSVHNLSTIFKGPLWIIFMC